MSEQAINELEAAAQIIMVINIGLRCKEGMHKQWTLFLGSSKYRVE